MPAATERYRWVYAIPHGNGELQQRDRNPHHLPLLAEANGGVSPTEFWDSLSEVERNVITARGMAVGISREM